MWFLSNLNLVLLASLYVTSDAGFVDILTKCSKTDNMCLKSLYESALHIFGKTGIPEINMPPVDPIPVNNIIATVSDTFTITLIEGLVSGVSTCNITNVSFDFEQLIGTQDALCDITVSGKVQFTGTGPKLQKVIGTATVDSQTDGKVIYEQAKLHVVVPFAPFKKDGEIYLELKFDNNYSYEIGKATLSAGNVYVGDQDISPFLVNYFNTNWKDSMNTFGKIFIDKSMAEYFDRLKIFFLAVPAKAYLTDITLH